LKLKLSILGLSLITLIIALALSLRSLNALRAENTVLRQSLEQMNYLMAENDRLSNSLAHTSNSLSEDQKRDLLRLRGEVASLRKQTNALATLQEANRRLREAQAQNAKRENTSQPEETPDLWRQTAIAKINDSRMVVLAMIMHAERNGGLITTNFNDLTNFLHSADSKFTGTNDFELLYSGKLDLLTNPSSIIVIRERTATLDNQGRWVKAYGFADGHSEYHKAEPDGNFERWERLHLPPPQQ